MLTLFLKEYLKNEKGKKLYEGKAKVIFASSDKKSSYSTF